METKNFRVVDGGDLEGRLKLSNRAFFNRNHVWST